MPPTLDHPVPAMLLAAGRGMRMRPLTDHTPKPLLDVRGQPLIVWLLEALQRGGFTRVVVNTAWLGEQIDARCTAWAHEHAPAQVAFSHEGQDFGYALETAGGISRALPLLGDVFWVLAGDVYAPDFVFTQDCVDRFTASDCLAHLWLVPNPPQHPLGDFGLASHGRVLNNADELFTYSTIGLYRRELFEPPRCEVLPGNPQGTAEPLAPLLRRAIEAGRVSGEVYNGSWTDVGTPDRLSALNAPLRAASAEPSPEGAPGGPADPVPQVP